MSQNAIDIIMVLHHFITTDLYIIWNIREEREV